MKRVLALVVALAAFPVRAEDKPPVYRVNSPARIETEKGSALVPPGYYVPDSAMAVIEKGLERKAELEKQKITLPLIVGAAIGLAAGLVAGGVSVYFVAKK